MTYPIPERKPHKLSLHNHVRTDDYFWMRDRENPEVIEHLNAENLYTEKTLGSTKKLQEELFQEMKGRIKEDESSAPYFKNGYWYYTRYEKHKEQPIYCRKKETLKGTEEILIDENEEAKKHPYYEVVAYSITKDNKIMAYAADCSGRRLYDIYFKNLETGEILEHHITNTGSDIAWHNDNETLYYSVKDKETLRPHLINSFNIKSGEQKHIYEEKDDTYIVNVAKTGDFQFIFIGSHSTLTTEFRFKSANDKSDFTVFLPRKAEHEYYPEAAKNGFYIKTNLDAKNFKLIYCPLDKRTPENWQTIQKHSESILLEDFEAFKTHIVVQEKENGLSSLKVYNRETLSYKIIPPTEETYTLYLDENPENDSPTFRIGYSSMTTPHSVYDINLETFDRKLIKQSIVLGEFSPENYGSKRVWATASDGVKIPVSLVFKKDKFRQDQTNPILIYAYGSYGATVDPYFSSVRLSLLDRGYVFAIAHVRGSEYLGTHWYEDGKLLKKRNTFTDFISAAEFLIKEKFCAANQVFAMGGSAGGLLMGAIANLRPELWKGIVSQVPFVDVVSTMIDDTIPLTTGEYDEWGNPNDKKYYDYMLSYSPYDQLTSKKYPNMLVTSGLHDSQVQYWEPTKYVAKIRQLKTDNNVVLLKTNMDAGHGGSAGRYEQIKEIALEYAFIIWTNENK